MTSAHRYSLPSQNESVRLPSLKDLNFQYRSQPPQDSPNTQQDHAPPPARHPSSWGRSNQNPPPSNPSISSLQSHPHQQHTPPLSAGAHENVVPKVEYPSKHENGGYAHPGLPLSAQVTQVPGSVNTGRNEDSPHSPNNSKRARTTTNMGSSSRDVRASHPYAPPQYASYPPASQPPAASPSYHQMSSNMASSHPAQPAPPPPPHEQMHQHPVPVSTHPGYGPPYQYMRQPPVMHQQHPSNPYPSPGLPPSAPPPQGPWGQQPQHPPPPQHHHQPPPPPQQPQQQQHVQHPSHIQPHHPPPVAPNSGYMVPHHMQPPLPVSAPQHPQQHPPPPQQQQPPPQYQQPPPPPQQLQQPSFARTTAIVPTNIDTRQQYQTGDPARNDTMAEINNHCSILYNFAHRYAQMQQSNPNAQPLEHELQEMSERALTVVRLLEELRRLNAPEGDQSREPPSNAMHQSPDDPRPPKRPWEDIDDTTQPSSESNNFTEQQQYSSVDVKPQSTAEQDMELIRTKRATSTAGSTGPAGQPKSKYRKRSRTAGYTAREVPFLQHQRDTRVAPWPGWS
ncbi:hypothetical protein M413DRAFT_445974 [Hebeloma cylindrosporum]|uniref:GATA-type domain-containing protein n=1 Tax=Hebeloma cylindrosporum TaxID=76867 RepID=A0A0C3C8H6_HEBCY|nr:hypothetical protein M413DRAFT_445974 [Hebeloma cylindrosporum h7]